MGRTVSTVVPRLSRHLAQRVLCKLRGDITASGLGSASCHTLIGPHLPRGDHRRYPIIYVHNKAYNVRSLLYSWFHGLVRRPLCHMRAVCGNTACINPVHVHGKNRTNPILSNTSDVSLATTLQSNDLPSSSEDSMTNSSIESTVSTIDDDDDNVDSFTFVT